METAMLSLDFEGRSVRFCGTPEKPEWVAADVCAILGLKKARTSLALLPDDEKGAHTVGTLGGAQEVITLYEPGLYRLLFKSKKAEAERLRRWVFHEVLPMIRRTGSFGLPAQLVAAQSQLATAQAQVAALLDVSTKQASAIGSLLARRGHQLRIEERAAHAIEQGQKLLSPEMAPIRTVTRAKKGGAK